MKQGSNFCSEGARWECAAAKYLRLVNLGSCTGRKCREQHSFCSSGGGNSTGLKVKTGIRASLKVCMLLVGPVALLITNAA